MIVRLSAATAWCRAVRPSVSWRFTILGDTSWRVREGGGENMQREGELIRCDLKQVQCEPGVNQE